jgi:hypothetical protein
MAKRKVSNETEILLHEYSTCQSSVESLDASVWQSAGIIGLVSIGTFALVAVSNPPIYTAILAGFFSTVGVFIWWRMAVRWWSVRDIKIERMRHIEEDLGVQGQTHYIEYMDRLYDVNPGKTVPADARSIGTLARRYGIQIDRARQLAAVTFQREGPRNALEPFRWIAAIVWAIYLLLRIAGTLWQFFGIKFFVFPFLRW